LFEAGAFRALRLEEGDLPSMQAFFDANPEYELAVNAEPPAPGRARELFAAVPPDGWPFREKWLMRFVDEGGAIAGVADVIQDLFAKGIWHVGLFIVATRLHGMGAGHAMYRGLEEWMREQGAEWLRLGVVAGNARAERFWEKLGYEEIRRRYEVPMGRRMNTLRIMAKALAGGDWAEYFERVERDR
jgi:GNAT superfamily N-acetyltransferase